MARGSLIALLLAARLAATAAAAAPQAGREYSGSGADYMNNGPNWEHSRATGQISFRTSSDRRRILDFHGTYSYYCGGGTAYIKATYINVGPSGSFAYDFSFPNEHAGRSEGRIYVAISGNFLGNGSSASVSYLVDTVFNGHSVRHPYSTSNPTTLGCASWVKGTARAQ